VVDPRDHAAQAAWWAEQIAEVEGAVLTYHPADKDPRCRTLCRFVIPHTSMASSHRRKDELRIEYSSAGQLTLRSPREAHSALAVPVSSIHEIRRLVERVRRQYAVMEAQEKKRDAVIRFKANAILAAIRRISLQNGFQFESDLRSDHVFITVRYPDRKPMAFEVNYDQFDRQLERLEALVQNESLGIDPDSIGARTWASEENPQG